VIKARVDVVEVTLRNQRNRIRVISKDVVKIRRRKMIKASDFGFIDINEDDIYVSVEGSLVDAVAAIRNKLDKNIIYVDVDDTLTDDLTIPSNITLQFCNDATITIVNGATITVDGSTTVDGSIIVNDNITA